MLAQTLVMLMDTRVEVHCMKFIEIRERAEHALKAQARTIACRSDGQTGAADRKHPKRTVCNNY